MLKCGHETLGGNPMAKRVIICCPTSLVNNWDSECTKWLKVSLSLIDVRQLANNWRVSCISFTDLWEAKQVEIIKGRHLDWHKPTLSFSHTRMLLQYCTEQSAEVAMSSSPGPTYAVSSCVSLCRDGSKLCLSASLPGKTLSWAYSSLSAHAIHFR